MRILLHSLRWYKLLFDSIDFGSVRFVSSRFRLVFVYSHPIPSQPIPSLLISSHLISYINLDAVCVYLYCFSLSINRVIDWGTAPGKKCLFLFFVFFLAASVSQVGALLFYGWSFCLRVITEIPGNNSNNNNINTFFSPIFFCWLVSDATHPFRQ